MAPRDAHKTDWSDPSVCLTIAVLGCTGDLAKKKTYPALFALFLHDHMPKGTVVVGYARSDLDDTSLRERVREYLKGPAESVDAFLSCCFYERGAYEDPTRTNVFGALGERMGASKLRAGCPRLTASSTWRSLLCVPSCVREHQGGGA